MSFKGSKKCDLCGAGKFTWTLIDFASEERETLTLCSECNKTEFMQISNTIHRRLQEIENRIAELEKQNS